MSNRIDKMTEEQALAEVMKSETLVKAAGNDDYTGVKLRTMADIKRRSPEWTDAEILEWMDEFGALYTTRNR